MISGNPYDIGIVGCGPVGALLATLLGRYGLRVVVLEREMEPFSIPRAAHLDDEALRILQAAGVIAEATEQQRVIDGLDIVSRTGDLLLRARKQGSPDRMNGFPSAMLIHQPTVETALRRSLRNAPSVDVRLGHVVLRVDVKEDGLGLHGSGPNGQFATECRWVVGCDGAGSLIRGAMRSPLAGSAFVQDWLVVDCVLKKDVTLPDRLLQIADPDRPTTYVPFPDPRRRWEFKMKAGESPEDLLRPESLRALLSRHIEPSALEIERAAVYTFRDATARNWRNGRMLIAGDAAHQMPPFLGQGLCAGMRDAHNLAWKLALVAKGAAKAELLDTYEDERRPHVQAITRQSVRAGRFIQLSGFSASVRDLVFRVLHRIPLTRKRLLTIDGKIRPQQITLSGMGVPRPAMVPQPLVETANGDRVLLDELLGDGFALIGLGVSPRAWVQLADLQAWQSLVARSIHLLPAGMPWPDEADGEVAVRDASNVLADWAPIDEGIIVVRPDRQAFGCYGFDDWKMAVPAVREALSLR